MGNKSETHESEKSRETIGVFASSPCSHQLVEQVNKVEFIYIRLMRRENLFPSPQEKKGTWTHRFCEEGGISPLFPPGGGTNIYRIDEGECSPPSPLTSWGRAKTRWSSNATPIWIHKWCAKKSKYKGPITNNIEGGRVVKIIEGW